MGALRSIWYFLMMIFPFGVVFVMGIFTSYLAKAHFYDKQKYNILKELQWIGYQEKVNLKIDNEIGSLSVKLVVCAILLFVYFSYAGDSTPLIRIALIVVYLFGLGGDSVKEDTSMKYFLEEYELDIDMNKVQKSHVER